MRAHIVLRAACARSGRAGIFELLWMLTTINGEGAQLQRLAYLGRGGFLCLYLCAALASSLCSLAMRHSANGAGGVLASCAFHALAAPNARHVIVGAEMGARQALAVQVALSSLPAFGGGGDALPVLVANGVPCVIGALAFYALS